MPTLRVLEPGLLTTVQDLGRFGLSSWGVPESGAVDALSLRVGNRLVGNPDGAAALEMTLSGGAFLFQADATVALAGAPMHATVGHEGGEARPFPCWTAGAVRAGDVLRVGAARWGVRAYLCVSGGVAVPRVMGSASTHLASGLGGLEKRALRAGDVLPLAASPRRAVPPALPAAAVADLEASLRRPTLRSTPGAHASRFDAARAALFWSSEFVVTDQSDRMGARLDGPDVSPADAGSVLTEATTFGAVQVPGRGKPIVLLADHPTTGGYAVIACVAVVDHPRLGQLRPRERVRFERVALDEARRAHAERERWLADALPAT